MWNLKKRGTKKKKKTSFQNTSRVTMGSIENKLRVYQRIQRRDELGFWD